MRFHLHQTNPHLLILQITYGIIHFVWRVLGGIGGFLVVSALPPVLLRK